jgi:hypothetical protein
MSLRPDAWQLNREIDRAVDAIAKGYGDRPWLGRGPVSWMSDEGGYRRGFIKILNRTVTSARLIARSNPRAGEVLLGVVLRVTGING